MAIMGYSRSPEKEPQNEIHFDAGIFFGGGLATLQIILSTARQFNMKAAKNTSKFLLVYVCESKITVLRNEIRPVRCLLIRKYRFYRQNDKV